MPGTGRIASRAAVATAALLCASLAIAQLASASIGANAAPAGGNVSTVTWGTTPAATTVTSEPSCPSHCTAFSGSPANTSFYFNVWNTGNISLTGLSYSITVSSGSPTFHLYTCTSSGGGTCTQQLTGTVGTSCTPASPCAETFGVPASPGSETYLRITLSLSRTVTISTSVNSISPRQIRAAVTNNA